MTALREVAEFVAGQTLSVDVETVTFAQHFPRWVFHRCRSCTGSVHISRPILHRKQFSRADFSRTLRDLGLTVTGAQPPYADMMTVTPQGAHKGAGLAALAEALGVPLERSVAFGDTDNDLAMFTVAGYAVQVGTLPLLAPHADEQLAGPEALPQWLSALADELEQAAESES